MLCVKCRKSIPDDAVFCPYCGIRQVKQTGVKHRGNGTGTAFRRAREKTWTARITSEYNVIDGRITRKYRQKGGFKTKTDALNYCRTLISENKDKPAAPPLSHYWQLYSNAEMLDLSANRQGSTKKAWSRIKALHNRPVDTITVSMLREVADKGYTYYVAKDMKTLLHHLFKLAGADGYADKSLPDYIKLPKLEETERTPFTEAEQAALWQAYDAGDKRAAIPLVMIYTGMMPGELQSLKVSMIDLQAKEIRGGGMKTLVRRKSAIYLRDDIVPVLADLMEGRTDYVLTHNEKKFYDDYYAVLQAAGVRRLTPYSCRHTTATALAITEGIAPQTIKKIMRWSTTCMLDRYAHPSSQDAKNALATLKSR